MSTEVKAIAKYVKVSPYKVRRVANLVRGLNVNKAEQLLLNLPHKGASLLYKVVKSAKSNAVNNNQCNESDLVVASVQINEGPMMKRARPRARGRMFQVIKRTSHIIVTVSIKGEK